MYANDSVRIFSINPAATSNQLRPGIYSIQHDPIMGFYLDIIQDELKTPSIIYGLMHERVKKCLTAYVERPASTGILLTGDKGTGKTLFMSLLADRVMKDLKLPVILVRTAYSGDQFEAFIQKIGECCILFDEFGKLYSKNKSGDDTNNQSALLAILDGIDKTKRLIILTENSELSINNYLLNRPSRIFYHFKYSKLDDESIIGFCDINKTPEKVKNGILDLCHRSFSFSFDNLQCIVEECKRFKILPQEAVKDLNIDVSNRPIYMEVISIEYKDPKNHNLKHETKFKPTLTLVVKPDDDTNETCVIQFSDMNQPNVSFLDDLDEKIKKTLPSDMLNHLKRLANERSQESIYLSASDLIYEDPHTLLYETDGYVVKTKKTNKSPFRSFATYY